MYQQGGGMDWGNDDLNLFFNGSGSPGADLISMREQQYDRSTEAAIRQANERDRYENAPTDAQMGDAELQGYKDYLAANQPGEGKSSFAQGSQTAYDQARKWMDPKGPNASAIQFSRDLSNFFPPLGLTHFIGDQFMKGWDIYNKAAGSDSGPRQSDDSYTDWGDLGSGESRLGGSWDGGADYAGNSRGFGGWSGDRPERDQRVTPHNGTVAAGGPAPFNGPTGAYNYGYGSPGSQTGQGGAGGPDIYALIQMLMQMQGGG